MKSPDLNRLLAPPGRKFLALALLGMLLVATPIAQVWSQYGERIDALDEAAGALPAMQQAVQTQRALLAHAPSAAGVLRGRVELEAQRQMQQRTVETRLATLAGSLQRRGRSRAHEEALQMQADWAVLLEAIGRRSIGARASDEAHELLVEQALLIIDLLGDATGLNGQAAPAITDLLAAARAAPRLHATLAALEATRATLDERDPRDAGAIGAARARMQRAASQALTPAEAAALRRSDPALGKALLAMKAALAARERTGDAAAAAALDAAAAHAAAELWHATQVSLGRALAEHTEALQLERAAFMATMSVLALLLLVVAARRPPPDPPPPPLPVDTDSTGAVRLAAESRAPTALLLHRLRQRAPVAVPRAGRARPPQR